MQVGRVGALLCLVVAVVAVASAMAGCGSGDGGTTASLPASPAGKADAANFDGVHSGEVQLVLQVKRIKKQPETADVRVVGSFMKAGEEALPQLDLAIESNGELGGHQIKFLSGPLLRSDKWVVSLNGKVYEPDPASFRELKSKFEEAQREEGGEGNAMACVEAAKGFDITDVVHHVSYEGKGELVDGTKIVKVGGDIDASAAIDELIKLGEGSPGCQAQLEAVGVPSAAELRELEKELKGSLAAARVTVSLDKHGLTRYFRVLANVELPSNEELEVELTMLLDQVNEVTSLPITHGYEPYPALLEQFGLDRQDVQRADAGEIYVGVLGALADRLLGREK
ncbi:MAG TPA: hypothetical protein VFN85_11820 [Solirubrobacterales bacterium]|nr:hypothetical protein [Solirubrobacterales bacterium]